MSSRKRTRKMPLRCDDVDVDHIMRDVESQRRRAPKGAEPAWRRLERVMEERRTAELLSRFRRLRDFRLGKRPGRQAHPQEAQVALTRVADVCFLQQPARVGTRASRGLFTGGAGCSLAKVARFERKIPQKSRQIAEAPGDHVQYIAFPLDRPFNLEQA